MSAHEDEPVELPPNRPPGMLGEAGLNVMKVDTFEPDGLNAGLTQESTWETRWLWIIVLYLVFFPAAAFVLWRSKRISRSGKIFATIVGLAGLVLAAIAIRLR